MLRHADTLRSLAILGLHSATLWQLVLHCTHTVGATQSTVKSIFITNVSTLKSQTFKIKLQVVQELCCNTSKAGTVSSGVNFRTIKVLPQTVLLSLSTFLPIGSCGNLSLSRMVFEQYKVA